MEVGPPRSSTLPTVLQKTTGTPTTSPVIKALSFTNRNTLYNYTYYNPLLVIRQKRWEQGFLNAFTHIGWTILFREYVPGVATAAFLNIPLSGYLFWRASRERYIGKKNYGLEQLHSKGLPF